jgi:hypothetical protein
MSTVIVTKIRYDASPREAAELPEEMLVDLPFDPDDLDPDMVEEFITNAVSDLTCYCVQGLAFEPVEAWA